MGNILSTIRNYFGTEVKTIDLVDEHGIELTDFDILSHSYEAQSEALKKGFEDLELLKKGFVDGGDEDKFLVKAEKLIKALDRASVRLIQTSDDLDSEAANLVSKADEHGQKKVKKVMDEWKQGKLNSSSGDKVTDQKQAIAIALSEAGLNKKKKKKVQKADQGQQLMEAEKAMGTGNTPGGKEYIEKAKYTEGDYANVIVKNVQGKTLFLKRAAEKVVAPNQYCLPGGHIDKDETPVQAAARELKEEANIDIKPERLYSCGKIKCPDGKWAYYFQTFDLTSDQQGALALLDGENSNAAWMSQVEWDKADLFFDLKEHLNALNGQVFEVKLNKAEDDDLSKAEGSRGGKIIGHTKSGKPIYGDKKAKHYKDFDKEDHYDAMREHGKRAKLPDSESYEKEKESEYEQHSKISSSHQKNVSLEDARKIAEKRHNELIANTAEAARRAKKREQEGSRISPKHQ